MVQISKGCLNEVIIISLQEDIKSALKGNIPFDLIILGRKYLPVNK